ncbi:MAG: sigma-54-dependent Fis family transcriptional regulator, partial [Deltaproteobacteria bacterium]|nr:sigma-54-dependent Fis family transcriptional regulator [Deltaproteobacteria bacterium]
MTREKSQNKKLLIAEDENTLRQILAELFSEKGLEVEVASDGQSAWEALQNKEYPVALLDIKMPLLSGLEILSRTKERGLSTQILIMTAQDSMENTIEAIKGGAFDYLAKPFELAEVEKLVEQAWQAWQQQSVQKRENLNIQDSSHTSFRLIGKSKAIREIYKNMGRVAASQVPVLISGESGTGKELVARA